MIPNVPPAAAPAGRTSDGRKLVVVVRPAPQLKGRIFTASSWHQLSESFDVVDLSDDPSDAAFDEVLPRTFAIVGQPDLPPERLARAERLRALLNVEGNFYPNVDYPSAFARGIRVLGCGPAYAQAVAEYSLGLALDLARGISREDRAFRAGSERYLGDGNADAILLRHSSVGFIGFGNLGRALRSLLVPFSVTLRVYDPWLPPSVLQEADIIAATLQETLRCSQFLFVLAAVTDDNQHLLDDSQLALIPAGARVVLVSRAAVVDYPALTERVRAGQFLAGVDVWPEEPVASDDPVRSLEGMVLSAHRAGGIPAAFAQIGEMVVDDLRLIAAALPPARMQVAAPELVLRYRNRPAG